MADGRPVQRRALDLPSPYRRDGQPTAREAGVSISRLVHAEVTDLCFRRPELVPFDEGLPTRGRAGFIGRSFPPHRAMAKAVPSYREYRRAARVVAAL